MENHYIIVIAALIIGAWCTNLEPAASDLCSYFQNCTCYNLKEYEVQCSSSKLDVVIHLFPDKYIQIDCYNPTANIFDIVPDVNIDVETFIVRFCVLPVLEFEPILQKFNITQLKELKVEECEIGNNSLSRIDEKFFQGIKSLKSLTIRETSKITFGKNLFKNLPNLLQLYMDQNKLTEIGYMFEHNIKLKVLHLSRNALQSLPAGIFSKLGELKELHLWKNKLTNISANYFIGLKSLESLELSLNSINYLEDNAFSELNELLNISLRSNKLGNINHNIFKNNHKLQNIRVGKNPNLTISDYVFANLFNLKTISMDECYFKLLPEHTFENCTNLTVLDLKNNRLNFLHKNLFKTLKKLQVLNLSYNKLVSLPDNIFSTLENLQDLNLERNQLTNINRGTFVGLSKLKCLVLKQNRIGKIDLNAFVYQNNLHILDLSHNELVEHESVFSPLQKIEKIFLSYNNISTFTQNILISAVNLKVLDLSHNSLDMLYVTSLVKTSNYNVEVNVTHNHISYIDFYQAELVANQNTMSADPHTNFTTTTQLDLANNPLLCDCNNFELIMYLKGKLNRILKTIVDIKIDDSSCSGPMDFKHILIKNLLPEQIICKYQGHGCPSECNCTKRPYDKAIVVDCSFKNLTYWPPLTLKGERIEVNMTKNLLINGPVENQGYEIVKNMFLSHNKLKSFDWCPPYIEILKLDHNDLKSLPSNVLKTFNMSVNFSNLSLESNPWSCGCSAVELQNFIKTYYTKIEFHNVLCESDGIPIINKNELCKSKLAIVAQIVIPILVFFLLTACVVAFYFRYKKEIKIWLFSKGWCLWFITEEELDKDKKYDIFLSFSHKDEDFVAQNLVPSLEKTFKLCIHSRDWIPGELINDQIIDSVYNSRRTVVVLSNNFLESAWGKLEFLMAHKQSIEEGRPRVIVIKLGDLNTEKMTDDFKAYIKTNTYVEWSEPWFWKKLLYALPHSSKNHSESHQRHANMMLKIDDKFELAPQYILQPDSTPPVVSIDTTLLKNPLNFNISSSINNFQPDVPLMNSK